MTESLSHAGDQDLIREPTVLSVEDISFQPPLSGLDMRYAPSNPFVNDPNANFEFSAEAADEIANMPAYDGGTAEDMSPVWRIHTEGPDHKPAPGQIRIPFVSQETRDRLKGLWESPKTRKVVQWAGVTAVAFASVVGAIDAGKAFAQDHSGPQGGDSGHGADNGNASHTGDVYTDYGLPANSHVGINDHVGPQAWATARAVNEVERAQQLPLNLDQVDQDSEPANPRPYTAVLPFLARQVSMDELPDAPTAVPPSPEPDPRADLSFEYGDGVIRAASVVAALPGDKVVANLQRVENGGPDTATNTVALITLDAGVDLDPDNPASDNCAPVGEIPVPADQPELIACVVDDGTMNSGESTPLPVDVGLIINADALPGDVGVQAELKSNQLDPNSANNYAHATIRVEEPPIVEPLVSVNGPAFDRPDSSADWIQDTETHPYLGSINGDDGQPIDAFKIVNPKTGVVSCAFTADGIMTAGERRNALDASCVTHFEYSETGIPVADNLNMPYVEWMRDGEKDHPIRQRLLKANGVKEGDGYTLNVAGDVLMKNSAGVSLQRDIRFPDGAQYITPHEDVRVVNRDGRLVLEVETGPNSWSFRDDKSGKFRITQTEDLGEANNAVHMRVVKGNSVENDELYIRVGDAEDAPEQGPFPIARVAESGTGPVVHASLILPVGKDHGTFNYSFEREGDRNLTPRELHNLGWRLEDMLRPELSITYATVAGIDFANMQANGHVLYPEEQANLLRNHGTYLLVDDHAPVGALNMYDQVATPPEQLARFAVESDGVLKARISPALDELEWVRIYGENNKNGKIASMSAVRQIFREKMERQVDGMNATHEAGGEMFFAMDFLHNIGTNNPFIYLPEVGGDRNTIGSFDRLLEYAQQVRNEIAAEKYPGLSFEGVQTSTTIPTRYEFDNKFMNPANIAAILRDHPEINQIDLYQEFWFGERHGRPVIIEDGVVRADEAATARLTADLIKIATALKGANPNATLALRNIAGIVDGSDPKNVEIRKIYWLHFIKAANATIEATGIRINIELVNGTGEQTTWGSAISGPNHTWSEEPFGHNLDDAGKAIFEGLRMNLGEVVGGTLEGRGKSPNPLTPNPFEQALLDFKAGELARERARKAQEARTPHSFFSKKNSI